MAKMNYLDFDLLIDQSKAGFKVQVLTAPAGVERASGEFTLPFDEKDIKIFLLSIGQPRRGVRRMESPQTDEVKKFGGRLFDAVFTKDVWACLRRSLDACAQQDSGLRIRLQLTKDAQALADLPWEYLYDAEINRFLALSAETPITRYLALSEPVRPLAIRPPLRVLVMISSPADFPALDVEQEWRNLQEALQDVYGAGLVVAERLEEASLSQLQRRLRRGEYHIFHFIGHGGFDEATQDGVLLLEDNAGRARAVSGQDLGTLLHDHRPLRLAILNACEGARASRADPFAGIAQSLVQQGIPAVIAMQFEISDEAAIAFSHEFYGAVADGYPVDAALGEARKAVYARMTNVEWGTPVLFMRSPDGRIFDLPAPVASQLMPDQVRPQAEPEQKPEARRPQPAPKPEPGRSEPSPQALLLDLDECYTLALEHFYTEHWPEAIDLLGEIVAQRPDYPGAAAKLEQARRQQTLVTRYAEAGKAYEAAQWAAAIEHLEAVVALDSSYAGAAARLAEAKRQQALAELYDEARRLFEAHAWQTVVKVFDRIREQDAAYPDPQGLLPAAREMLAAQERERRLAALYGQAMRDMDARRLDEARAGFEEVARLSPGYKQTEALLGRVRTAIAQREAEVQRQARLAELSGRATDLIAARDWDGAEKALIELRQTGASQVEVAAQLAEVERQRSLEALYRQGLAHFQAQRWPEAAAALEEIVQADPAYAPPEHEQASALLARVQQAEQEAGHRAEEQQHARLLESLYHQAEERLAAQDWQHAVELLHQIQDTDPSFRDVASKLAAARRQQDLAEQFAAALSHFQAGRWQDAVTAFQPLVRAEPDYADPTWGKASALLLQARQQRELVELPAPPPGKSRKPAGLPEEPKPSDQPDTRSAPMKPGTRPKDLPK